MSGSSVRIPVSRHEDTIRMTFGVSRTGPTPRLPAENGIVRTFLCGTTPPVVIWVCILG